MKRTTTTTEPEFTTLGAVGEKYSIEPRRLVALFNRGEFTGRLFKVGRSFKNWQVTPEEVREWRRRIERKPGHFDKKDASDYRLDPSSASARSRRNSR